jgi:replication-associated recombination protein RarA
MKDLGYSQDYKWETGFKHDKNYLPNDLGDEKIFQ